MVIEDDVFFFNEDTLLNIDNKYLHSDLLTNAYTDSLNDDINTWHWKHIKIKFAPPYYKAMVCITRFSKKMIVSIDNYAKRYKTLFFLEALFPSIAKVCSLKYDTPEEFFNIIWKRDYKKEDINVKDLYHPVKNLENHLLFRSI